MSIDLILKETVLDDVIFKREKFLEGLISKALEYNAITEEEYEKISGDIQVAILRRIEKNVKNLAYGFREITKIMVPNYLYIVSRWMYDSMSPSESIVYLKENSFEKILSNALRAYELELSNKYFELEKFKKSISGKGTAVYQKYLEEIMLKLKKMAVFENNLSCKLDLTNETLVFSYSTLDSDIISGLYRVDAVLRQADSYMMEYNIRKKVGFDTLKKFESFNFRKNKEKEILREIEAERNEKIAKEKTEIIVRELEEERKDRRVRSERKVSHAEYIEIYERELTKIEKYDLPGAEDFEIENSLKDIFIEFVCVILNFEEGISIPKEYLKKHELVASYPKDKIFEIIFSHHEIFEFTDDEKEYLRKYLF